MGGGYYDRTFSFMNRARPQRPLLVGIAYEAQCTSNIPAQPWDVLLDAVITEKNIHCFSMRAHQHFLRAL
jgi:5-formyltetrahydrofolate cyclo-ligase